MSIGQSPATVQEVDFQAGDEYGEVQLMASLTQAPFQFVWSNAPSGEYSLEAQLFDRAGDAAPTAGAHFFVRPVNDNFADRSDLQTNFAWMSGRIAGASREPGEPAHNGDSSAGSVWWTWTPPVDGKMLVGDPAGQGPAGLAMYTGSKLSTLAPIVSSPWADSGQVETTVSGGVPVQFAVTKGSSPNVNFQMRFYPPPPNDNFSNRYVVHGSSVTLEGYTVGATAEPDEPVLFLYLWSDHSIWWTWTAPDSGSVTLQQTAGGGLAAGVFTGDALGSLQLAAGNLLYDPFTFEVQSNTTYQIELVTYDGEEEHVAADWEFTARAANDAFANRPALSGTNFIFAANNAGATTEPGEPALQPGGSGRTLWWSWAAPADGRLYLVGEGFLDLFQGDALNALQRITYGRGDISSLVISNETYQIRYDSTEFVGGESVQLDFIPAPANDKFANATVLSGLNLSTNGTMRGAYTETNDPSPNNTVWYSWTAPQDSSVIVALLTNTDFCSVHAYTGSSLTNLTAAGIQSQPDSLLLNAQAGVTYYFEVSADPFWEPAWLDRGPFQLLLEQGAAPANDNFVNAAWVTGTSALLVATNWAATVEANDPFLTWGVRRTVWFTWQAPASGLLLLTNAGSSVDPWVYTFLGTDHASLTLIGFTETPVHSNDIVQILMDGEAGRGGVLQVGLLLLPAPANDDFANAAILTGTSCSLTGEVYTATGESTNSSDRLNYSYRDIWWQWTAPGDGQVSITNFIRDASPSVAVYTGTALTNLQLVNRIWRWYPPCSVPLQFNAVGGTTYYVQGIAGYGVTNLDWQLVETLAAPALTTRALMQRGRQFQFQVHGAVGARYQVEYSSDLQHWQVLESGTLTNTDKIVTDPQAGAAATRFYRSVPVLGR